MSYRG